MKTILRIPTKEQYAYMEFEYTDLTPAQAVDEYLKTTKYYWKKQEEMDEEPPFESVDSVSESSKGPRLKDYLNK